MATYASLTPEQKDKLAFFTTQLRGQFGKLATFLDNVDDLKVHYQAQGIAAIIALLDAGEIIPNASGLAGSADLTKAQLQTAISAMDTLLTTYNTQSYRENYDLLAGPLNTYG